MSTTLRIDPFSRYQVVAKVAIKAGSWFYEVREPGTGIKRLLRIFPPALGNRFRHHKRALQQRQQAESLRHRVLGQLHELGTYTDPVKRSELIYTVEDWYDPRDAVWNYLRKEKTTLGVIEAVSMCSAIADLLAKFESFGVVHGSLNPNHVIFKPGQGVLVVHPSVAQLASVPREFNADERTSLRGLCRPPEASAYSDPTLAADCYGLGAILFFLLSGKVPKIDTNSQDGFGVPSIQRYRDDVPERLRLILAHALSADPVHRYSSGLSFGDDLRAVADGFEPKHASSAETSRLVLGVSGSHWRSRNQRKRWLRMFWLLAAGVLGAALSVVIVWVLR